MSSSTELRVGLLGESEKEIDTDDLADQVGSGDLPVFATPCMAALMENAAMKCLSGRLKPGTTSVGVSLSIEHVAATPAGHIAKAQAKLVKIEGKKLSFEITVWDNMEKIGEGSHQRVLVCQERFMSQVKNK
jgi:predicted thioesterase